MPEPSMPEPPVPPAAEQRPDRPRPAPPSVLIIAYAFPPSGGAGVQRLGKLAKYLPMHGVEPQALTASNPSVPVTDSTLTDDLPAGMRITLARTLEPGYSTKQAAWSADAASSPTLRQRVIRMATAMVRQLAFPDIQVLWLPAAWRALRRLQRSAAAPDAVIISGPPFSPFLLAGTARRRCAVILDYRDEWRLIREQMEMTRSRLSRWFGDRVEAAVLRRADMVTMATDEYRASLLQRFPFVRPDQVVAIPNGFDPSDFPATLRTPPTDRLRLTFAGTVYRVTRPAGLLEAVREVHRREPQLAALLEVQFIGRVVDSERAALDDMRSLGVRTVPYLPHQQLLEELSASHLTMCILDDLPGAENIYPGKIFELMHLGRPCLVLCPEGALSRLVHETELGRCLRPRDVEGITELLIEMLHEFRAGRAPGGPDRPQPIGIERFDRRVTAGQFAEVVRAAIRSRSERR